MKRETHIVSYFSIPTDLAGEMQAWPEFVTGHEYSVALRSAESGEAVSVQYVDADWPYVLVAGDGGSGVLYDRVLGRVVYALSLHSDNVMVYRRD